MFVSFTIPIVCVLLLKYQHKPADPKQLDEGRPQWAVPVLCLISVPVFPVCTGPVWRSQRTASVTSSRSPLTKTWSGVGITRSSPTYPSPSLTGPQTRAVVSHLMLRRTETALECQFALTLILPPLLIHVPSRISEYRSDRSCANNLGWL